MFLHFDLRKKRGKHEPVKPRFLVLRRRTLTLGAALLAAAAIFGAVNAPAAVRASAATRQLPIYCVERDQKVCSISFDAAWGDGRMRQCGLSKKSVKTKSSLRTLPLVGSFRDYFMQVKEAKELNKKVCGNCYNYEYDSFVFVDEMGERMKMNYLTSAFPKFLERPKLRRTRFHDLRHSCASLLLANGVPIKQIRDWLGHSDFSTTANIYAHLDYSTKLSSADA